jgi:hypothetical protein
MCKLCMYYAVCFDIGGYEYDQARKEADKFFDGIYPSRINIHKFEAEIRA